MDQLAIVGRIRKPQGIRGEVTVELLTDEPERFFAPGRRLFAGTVGGDVARSPTDRHDPESRHALTIDHVRPFREGLLVKFDVIPDRSAAERWRQRYLLVPTAELTPPADDEVFIHELVGMTVRDEQGTEIGEVTGYYELPQGLTLDVKLRPADGAKGGDMLIPYRPSVISEVDLDTRVITVDRASGLFD